MKNRTLLLLLFVVGFVGATSCGDNSSQSSSLAAENAALRAQLAQSAPTSNAVNVTMTQIATSVVNTTITNGTLTTATGIGTTVVYTVTSNSVGTAIQSH